MKSVVAIILMVLTGMQLLANPSSDSTAISFEIYLNRKADNPLGFNTCNIDRVQIFNLVMQQIREKIETQNFYSVSDPKVVMKFDEYVSTKESHDRNQFTKIDKQSLEGHQYNYFIKICGNLDIDSPLNQFQKATFKLKVYVFDGEGNLIAKSKSKATDNDLSYLKNSKSDDTEETYPLNEQEFFSLVTDAATSLDISI